MLISVAAVHVQFEDTTLAVIPHAGQEPILHRNKVRRERRHQVVAVESEGPALGTPVRGGVVVQSGTELFQRVGSADHENGLVD
jgi:hypothetical protein